MALGAERGRVFRSVLGSSFRVIGIGLILGVVTTFATNRVISSQVSRVALFDPIALLGGLAAILILGGAACAVPALRATRVDPVVALRDE